MSDGENFVLCASRAVVAALLLFSGPGAVAGEPEGVRIPTKSPGRSEMMSPGITR